MRTLIHPRRALIKRLLSSSWMCQCSRFMRGLPEVWFTNRGNASLRTSTGGGRLRRRPGLPFWKRSRWMRTRKRKRWRSRGSFLISILVVGAGACLLAASALMDCSAHLHTTSLSFIQTHGSAMCWWMVGPGSRGLASLGHFLPAGSPGQVKYTGGTGFGTWHPLTPSWVPVCGASSPQILEVVEVVQHVHTAGF